jgi:hypothetical protein
MSTEYIRKKTVQLNQQVQKREDLFEAIMKSDSDAYDKLVTDADILIDCSIPLDYNYLNIFQIIVKHSTCTFIDNIFKKYCNLIDNSIESGKHLIPVACERG